MNWIQWRFIVVLVTYCDGIVLPTSVTADLNNSGPRLDELIREIFVTSNNVDAYVSNIEQTKTYANCSGLCVPAEDSCGTDFDDYGLQNNEADFFDIRFSADKLGDRSCKDESEKCCEIQSYIELSSKPQTASGPITIRSCGISRINSSENHVITTGKAEYGEFPWMVAVLVQKSNSHFSYKCGGSLIHPSVILTVAHCVHKIPSLRLRIRVGHPDHIDSYSPQERSVHKVIVHSSFNASRYSLHNDIALVILDNPLHLAQHIGSVCLPTAFTLFDRARCVVSGWGNNSRRQRTERQVLKKIRVPIVPRNVCERTLRTTRLGRTFRLHQSFICAGGEPGRDACHGDGGSPLVCVDPGTVPPMTRFVQVGIVALGIGCGNHIPGVYVNVPEFRPWIDEQMSLNGFMTNFYM